MSAYNELQLSSLIDQVFERLRKIEEQLAVLSEKAGVAYEATRRKRWSRAFEADPGYCS